MDATDESRRAWVKRVTSGDRSPLDHLTDAERQVLDTLRRLGHEIAPAGSYRRYIKKAAA